MAKQPINHLLLVWIVQQGTLLRQIADRATDACERSKIPQIQTRLVRRASVPMTLIPLSTTIIGATTEGTVVVLKGRHQRL